jgi:hypothetical protein
MQSRTRVALVALSLIAGGLGAMGLASSSSSAATPTTRPTVGQCHQLTIPQVVAVSDTKRAVRCTARHNLQTVAVVTSPTTLAGLTDEQLRAAGEACLRPFFKALGPMTRQAVTNYDLFMFAPTAEQRAAGARWIRCDVGLVRASRLAALPRHRLPKPIVPSRVTDNIRTCLTQGRVATTCNQRHAYRAVKAFVLAQRAYPTNRQLRRAANQHCQKGWDLTYAATPIAWAHGSHTIVCSDKTRR